MPRAPMTSIFEGQPPQNKDELPSQKQGIPHLGSYGFIGWSPQEPVGDMTQLIQLMKPGIPQGALDDKAKCDVLSRIFSENNVDREGS